jgi:hypothetical protein
MLIKLQKKGAHTCSILNTLMNIDVYAENKNIHTTYVRDSLSVSIHKQLVGDTQHMY